MSTTKKLMLILIAAIIGLLLVLTSCTTNKQCYRKCDGRRGIPTPMGGLL